jgi:hypothetical protein
MRNFLTLAIAAVVILVSAVSAQACTASDVMYRANNNMDQPQYQVIRDAVIEHIVNNTEVDTEGWGEDSIQAATGTVMHEATLRVGGGYQRIETWKEAWTWDPANPLTVEDVNELWYGLSRARSSSGHDAIDNDTGTIRDHAIMHGRDFLPPTDPVDPDEDPVEDPEPGQWHAG